MAVTIVNFGLGNIGSIKNIFQKLGAESNEASDAAGIRGAEMLVLPGVGAFDHAISRLDELRMRGALDEAVLQRRVPIVGICLGMQLMTDGSDEGICRGLGWVQGRARRFNPPEGETLKVPHMGWCSVSRLKHSRALSYLNSDARFYFVHSFYVECRNRSDALLSSRYGPFDFDAAFEKENILGFQFHPEKSHKYGVSLLKGFLERE